MSDIKNMKDWLNRCHYSSRSIGIGERTQGSNDSRDDDEEGIIPVNMKNDPIAIYSTTNPK